MPFANKNSTLFLVVIVVAFALVTVEGLTGTFGSPAQVDSGREVAASSDVEPMATVVNADGTPYDPTMAEGGDAGFDYDSEETDFVDPYASAAETGDEFGGEAAAFPDDGAFQEAGPQMATDRIE